MRTPIPAPSVGKSAMQTKFDPVKRPKMPLGASLKLAAGGIAKKGRKGSKRGS